MIFTILFVKNILIQFLFNKIDFYKLIRKLIFINLFTKMYSISIWLYKKIILTNIFFKKGISIHFSWIKMIFIRNKDYCEFMYKKYSNSIHIWNSFYNLYLEKNILMNLFTKYIPINSFIYKRKIFI